jgi:hypothetical protein
MHRRIVLAVAIAVAVPGVALAAPKVTVRVEGKSRTLLPTTAVQTHTGSITKGGAPKGTCSAASGAGALDVATHHRWSGSWDTMFGDYFVKTILGDTEGGTKSFWEIFVNNVAASSGMCGIRLRSGDKLLFAAVPASGTEYPLGLIAPSTAAVGHTFTVKVVYHNAKGTPKPLAGATVSVNGHSGNTGSGGTVTLTPSHAGTFTISATKTGYIRAASVTLTVH